MKWWHDNMITWWHDNMIAWWHDDIITWWNVLLQSKTAIIQHKKLIKFATFILQTDINGFSPLTDINGFKRTRYSQNFCNLARFYANKLQFAFVIAKFMQNYRAFFYKHMNATLRRALNLRLPSMKIFCSWNRTLFCASKPDKPCK